MSNSFILHEASEVFPKHPNLRDAFVKRELSFKFAAGAFDRIELFIDKTSALRAFAHGGGGPKWQDGGDPNFSKDRPDTVGPLKALLNSLDSVLLALEKCEEVAQIHPPVGQINVTRAFMNRLEIVRDSLPILLPVMDQIYEQDVIVKKRPKELSDRTALEAEIIHVSEMVCNIVNNVGVRKGRRKPENIYFHGFVRALADVCSFTSLPIIDAFRAPSPEFINLLEDVQQILPRSAWATNKQSLKRRATQALADWTSPNI